MVNKRITDTILKRYGPTRDSIKQKTKETCIAKYGCSSPLGNPTIRQKIRDTNTSRYGYDNAAKSDDVKNKTKETCIVRYGEYSPSMSEKVKRKISTNHARAVHGKLNDPIWLADAHKIHTLTAIADSIGVGCSVVSSRFAKYGLTVHRHFSTSKPQEQINDYIQSLGFDTSMNEKIPYMKQDIDILVKSKRIGIEVNGVYWHSELNNKHKTYHLNKTTRCRDNGIGLIHIWDTEWTHQQDIVKSRLRAIFGVIPTRIGGRQCDIVYPSKLQTREFLVANHIQGWCASSTCIGL